MAWRRSGDKPLSEAMVFSLLTHICVTRPQWVNSLWPSEATWWQQTRSTLDQVNGLLPDGLTLWKIHTLIIADKWYVICFWNRYVLYVCLEAVICQWFSTLLQVSIVKFFYQIKKSVYMCLTHYKIAHIIEGQLGNWIAWCFPFHPWCWQVPKELFQLTSFITCFRLQLFH